MADANANRKYRLTYMAAPDLRVEWIKTLDELLAPNGDLSLLDYMLSESHKNGTPIELISVDVIDENYHSEVRA